MPRNAPRIEMPESEENEFASFSLFSPSRAPLNSIPDPSQLRKTTANHLSGFDLAQKLELARTQQGPERRGGGAYDSNPRIVSRSARSRSEPNSAQSTPTRNGATRVSLGGGGCVTGARVVQSLVGRGRIPRGISMADYAETAQHFEMNEDHSFWKEHNVQVLIRLRPLSAMERATQGHGRCLKQESPQTLVWLGHPETRFTFDHVASETISQEKLFRVAGLPMVENCLSGYNSCVFAYGQTGSGKTYTMMGEISEAEGSLGEDCGVTARIFEYLFSRIKMEEEGRRDEKLRFSCKCSFLEIYNEQITDLLEPSSTNLQLREDFGKGVYVENLVEHNVRTVNDVLKLLLQGAANRKIAATHMNSESSRSHSVFTCTIESIWERDSLTHSRFARLNLVDLAGSERQKSSGAEGDRLKEAANINKSLSTLGLVIMSLVDLAHGKHRHVPYRDSRLTFLLQDSLGGNSKTMIIANVSPSLCSTNETLSTLKFAQRAKLIQNNAKVNEDASGDVTALQQEIRKLKVQLSSLVKSHNSCGALSDCIASLEEPRYSGTYEVARKTQDKCHCQVNNSLRKKENEVEKKFEDCRKMNSSLVRELDEIQAGLGRYLKFDQIQSDFVASPTSGAEQVNQAHKHSTAETMSTIGENKEEVCFSDSKNCSGINDDTDNPDDNRVQIINESQDVLEENDGSMNNKSSMEREAVPRIEGHDDFELSGMVNNRDAVMKADEGADRSVLQFKLRKVIKDLEEAKTLNSQYEKEQKLLLSQQQIESIVCSFPQVKRKNRATKMTSRLPFFFSVFLYTVTTLVSTASGATSCRTSCGSIQINYPFGIDRGCGSPQFNGMLNCSSSTDLFFFTPSGGYKVRSINYDKNTMLVFDPLMSTCSILQPHHDLKLSDIQNALIRPSYDTVFALFNCSNVSPVQNRYKSLCFNAAAHSCDELYSSCTSFRIFNTTSPYGNSSTVHTTPYCCFTSYDTVRVMSMNILDCSHYTTVIDDGKMKGVAPIDWSYGIELSYSAPEIGCSLCQKSGGTCGYDDETEIFLCQCSNNVSPRDCGGVSDQGSCNSTKADYPMLFLVMLVSFICAIL